MGKTPKPVSILIADPVLYDTPAIQALCQQGHIIHPPGEVLSQYDVVIGSNCYKIDPALGKLDGQIAVLLKALRAKKYPPKAKGDV